ncbi:MAG: hypothetical protein AAF849_20170 [Bacteroidota bacterium]
MNKTTQILLFAVLLIGLFVVLRFPFFLLRFAILFLFLAVLGLYLRQIWLARKQKERPRNETEKSIFEKLAYSKAQVESIEKESQSIRENIANLELQLSDEEGLSPNIRLESQRLLKEFQEELNLRKTKLEFYKSCIKKLQSILHNFRLSKELEKKQANLKQLRENNMEDIADLEAFKTAIEFEAKYLKNMDALSLKMLDSHSLQDAESVRLELEKITKELP